MRLKTLLLLMVATIFAVPTIKAQDEDVFYVATGTSKTSIVTTANPSKDAVLTPTSNPGVYSGQVKWELNVPFNFYQQVDGQTVWYVVDPSKDEETNLKSDMFVDGFVTLNFMKGTSNTWASCWKIYGQYPANCDGTFNVVLNTNSNTVIVSVVEASAPDHIYVWYSEQGPAYNSYFNKSFTLNPTADENQFEAEVTFPEIGDLDILDPESGETSTGSGVYFYLSDSGTSYIGSGITTYMAALDQGEINIPDANDNFSATLVADKSGSPLNIKNGGKVKITFNWKTNVFNATMVDPNAAEEPQDVIYIASGTNYFYVAAKEGDPYMTLNPETGWYEGYTLNAPAKNYAWKFYKKDENGDPVYYCPLSATAVSFQNANPYTASYTDGNGNPEFGKGSWRATAYLPDNTVTSADIELAINLTTGQVKFEQVNIPEIVPEAFYLWGTEKGAGSSYKQYGKLVPSATNPDLYELTYDVPSIPEGTLSNDDEPVPGFMFSIGNSASSYAPTTMYNAEYATQGQPTTFEFANTGDTKKVQLYIGTTAPNGNPLSSMYDVTPGETLFSFNYKTNELTLTYTAVPEVKADELTINFIGDNVTLGDDINQYVKIVDMFAMIMSGGTNDGVLDINSNPYKYVYAEGQPQMQLVLTPAEGYKLNIEIENQGDVQIEAQSGETDVWMLVGGQIGQGVIANITISKDVPVVKADELTINFIGDNVTLGNDINQYVKIVDYFAMIMSDGETDGVLNIDSNPYKYVYANGQPQIMLEVAPAAGYSLNIELENQGDAQIYLQGGETGVWMIQGGQIGQGVIANITISKAMNAVTLNFGGLENSYNYLTIMDLQSEDGDMIEVDGTPFTFKYDKGAGLMITAKDGYEIAISCDVESADGNYTLQPIGALAGTSYSGFTSYMLGLYPDANGLTFNINVTEAPNTVTFDFVSSEGIAKPYLYVNAIDYVTTDVVELVGDEYVVSYDKMGGLILSAKDGYAIDVTCSTPGITENKDYQIMALNADERTEYIVGVFPSAAGATFKVDVTKAMNAVTLNFGGLENSYQYLTIMDLQSEDGDIVEVDETPFTFKYDQGAGLMITAKDGYEIAISCDVASADGNYTLQPVGALAGTSFSGFTSYMLGLYPDANGLTFNIDVTKAPNKVTFDFVSSEGIAKPYLYVNAVDYVTTDVVELVGDEYVVSYQDMGGLILSAKDGYAIDITCSTPGITENKDYQIMALNADDRTEYIVGVFPSAAGATFKVDVTKAMNAVTLNFGGLENSYQYLTIMDLQSEDGDIVEVDGTPFTFKYDQGAGLMITAKDGYEIAISCDVASADGNYTLQPVGALAGTSFSGFTSYMLGLYPDANGLTFNIDVTEAPHTVTFEFVSSEGLVKPYQYVEAATFPEGETVSLVGDEYVLSYENMGGLSLVAKEGYTIDITCSTPGITENKDYQIMSLDADDSIQYTVGVFPSAAGATFKVNVTKNVNSGILSIYDIDGSNGYTVVNMSGMVIVKNGTAEDLNNLANGLYIINGKKVIVRK